jgi:hypothetical protein
MIIIFKEVFKNDVISTFGCVSFEKNINFMLFYVFYNDFNMQMLIIKN